MKPTISNAFNQDPVEPTNSPDQWKNRMSPASSSDDSGMEAPAEGSSQRESSGIASMEVDLRETNFGWSLDLTPMHAIDALQALHLVSSTPQDLQYLVLMEQSAWREGDEDMAIGEIARRMDIAVIEQFGSDALVMRREALRQLVGLCHPTRMTVVAVDGELDQRDVDAITRAIDTGISPLLAEIRAVAALEVLGDRSVVLHSRQKCTALSMIADNFRHYLAAISSRNASTIEAPQDWQIERLTDSTGSLTVRPIETQVYSTAIDVGVNTTKERFTRPANRSLIYDIHSNTWHDEA